MLSLGIDVGGTSVKAGLIDERYCVAARASLPTPAGDAAALTETVCRLAYELGGDLASIRKVGVTVPGTVDNNGVVEKLTNLGLYDIPLGRMLSERLKKPVSLINDADAAALAELNAGALRGVQNGLMLTIGTGLGGAIILNGRLFKGGRSRGTEPGHMILQRGGLSCGCGGHGCAETLCSASALARLAQNACNEGKGMIYSLNKSGRSADAKLLLDCAAVGDEYALDALGEYIDALSDALASFVNILDPEVIVIGGGVSAAGETLLAPLRRATADKCFFGSCGDIVAAETGNDAGMIGAVILE